jgi:tRNA modification GTPase
MGDRDQDTICAVATPFGRGGISVIRISGTRALAIVRALCPFMPAEIESHRVYYGMLLEKQTAHEVDEVMATYFKEGRSFTGEDSVEISCHGNPVLCERILQNLVSLGARTADRGEFTYRAFINGRIDLVQAESVLSLIESQTKESSRLALDQLRGELSKNLLQLESELTWCLAHIEAGIDFSTEGLDVVDQKVLIEKLETVGERVKELVESYQLGRLLKDGVKVALIGRPNVGKSSLLNRLVEDDRAIVTDIPGTTRDVVSAETLFKEYKFSLLDTAGLRDETMDVVEKIGIEKTRLSIKSSDFLLFVVEALQPMSQEETSIFESLDLARTFVVVNKVDLSAGLRTLALEPIKNCKNFKELQDPQEFLSSRVLWVSSFDKNTRPEIFERLLSYIKSQNNENPTLLIQARHFECLNRALLLISGSLLSLKTGAGGEYLALDLKQSLLALQEVLGKRFDDQIMDRVFKEFCIGK